MSFDQKHTNPVRLWSNCGIDGRSKRHRHNTLQQIAALNYGSAFSPIRSCQNERSDRDIRGSELVSALADTRPFSVSAFSRRQPLGERPLRAKTRRSLNVGF